MNANNAAVFVICSDDVQDKHRFVTLSPADPAELVKTLAPRIRQAYFDIDAAEQRLRRAAAELTRFNSEAFQITESEIERALEEELDAVLPAEWKGGRPRQTDTQRSELAEIIAAEILRLNFGSLVPASRIAAKEIPDQQTRGVDVLAIEDISTDSPTLIIAEVKGSCEAKTPPAVVADMAKKLKEVASERRTMLQELIWLRDHCDDEYLEVCTRMCARYQLRKYEPNIVFAPVLVRTRETSDFGDFGIFYKQRDKFPYTVRFASAILDVEDLFTFAVAVYKEARRLNRP
ncbi:SAVED domain-containing protein [Nonomuraea fuscirosea]|uniref:Hachiman antiphage defense system protein HamA n=1 Tax=Nonomuraea fuscirosea TaxID=1291556 RepID=UPI002DD963BF|nr:Hachiman antiphage defense system protein HamA [Nonomuraea fuscirosea]WSA53598.1 SAVED domain-containing protein [Nonomuraea fuscirosea]